MLNKKIIVIILLALSKAGMSHGLEIKSQFIDGLNTINDFTYGGEIYTQACNSGQLCFRLF